MEYLKCHLLALFMLYYSKLDLDCSIAIKCNIMCSILFISPVHCICDLYG